MKREIIYFLFVYLLATFYNGAKTEKTRKNHWSIKIIKEKKGKTMGQKTRRARGERESVRCYSYIKRCKEMIGISVLLHYHSFSQLSSLSATNSDLFFWVQTQKHTDPLPLPLLSLIFECRELEKPNTVLLCAQLFLLFFWYLHYFHLFFLSFVSLSDLVRS